MMGNSSSALDDAVLQNRNSVHEEEFAAMQQDEEDEATQAWLAKEHAKREAEREKARNRARKKKAEAEARKSAKPPARYFIAQWSFDSLRYAQWRGCNAASVAQQRSADDVERDAVLQGKARYDGTVLRSRVGMAARLRIAQKDFVVGLMLSIAATKSRVGACWL
jgi:hypothetical protein